MNIRHFPRPLSKQGCQRLWLSLVCFFSIFAILGTSSAAEQSLQAVQRGYYPGAAWPNYEIIVDEFRNNKFLVKITAQEGHQKRAPEAIKEDGKEYANFFLTRLTNPEQGQLYFCIMPLTKFQSQPVNAPHYYDTAAGLISKQYPSPPGGVDTVANEVRQAMYFGYGCLPNRSLDNYFATQIYIWEKLGFKITPGTAFGRTGDLSWYPAFKQDLERRKNAYLTGLPSFAGQNYELEPGQETLLKDDKQVLESLMVSAGFMPEEPQRIEGERGYVDISWIYPNSLSLRPSEDFANSVPVNIAWGGPSTVYCLDNGTEQAVIAPEYSLEPNAFSFTLTSTVKWLPPTPTASLTIQKVAPQVVDWERLELGEGRVVCRPLYEERGLAEVGFRLRSTEDVVTEEEGLVPAGEFSLEFTTDWEGKAHFTDLPCANYVLEEIKTPAGYVPVREPISLSVVEDTDPLAADQPFEVRNSRIPFSLKAFKVLQDVQDLDPAALEANVGQMRFGLELAEDFANAYTSLPAGSLVAVSGLTELENSNYALGERPRTGELWTSLELTPPFPGRYRLVELNSGAYHEAMEALELDLSNLESSTPLADGTRALMLNFPLYNQRIVKVPEGSRPEPDQVPPTDPRPLPSSEAPQIIVEPHIQNSSPPINLEINQVAPDPAPGQTPPIRVGSYVERLPDNANLAVQLPRTGAADVGMFSTLLVLVGAFIRKVNLTLF